MEEIVAGMAAAVGSQREKLGQDSVTNPPGVRLTENPPRCTETGHSTRITLGHSRVTNIQHTLYW
jgi:hypothetical protein